MTCSARSVTTKLLLLKVRPESAFLWALLLALFYFSCFVPWLIEHEVKDWVCSSSMPGWDGKTGEKEIWSDLKLATASALSGNGTKTVRCWLPYLVVCPLMSAFVNPYVLRIKQSMPGKRMEGKIWHTDAEGDDAEAGFAPLPLTCWGCHGKRNFQKDWFYEYLLDYSSF